MGNQNCSQIYQQVSQNQSYGDYKIIKQPNTNNKIYALIQKTLQNDQQLHIQVRQKLQTRLRLKSNHLVKLQKYNINTNKYSTNVQMYYEYINKTLQDKYHQKLLLLQNLLSNEKLLLNEKRLLSSQRNLLSINENTTINQSNSQYYQQLFTQRQLFNIIYGVQQALQQLNKYDIRHGCINLSTVLCQNNFYKITDVSSTTFVKSYDLVRRGCRNQLLSHKLLTNLQYRSLQPFYQLEDDLFSLGMIILTITSKVDPKYFYLWKQKNCTAQLKWEHIQVAIKKIQRTYSSKLSRKVKQLIGFGQQLDKSLQTNSTTANNVHNISSYKRQHVQQNNELIQITQSINTLDKDIDRILSRINLNNNNNNHNHNSNYINNNNHINNNKQSSQLLLNKSQTDKQGAKLIMNNNGQKQRSSQNSIKQNSYSQQNQVSFKLKSHNIKNTLSNYHNLSLINLSNNSSTQSPQINKQLSSKLSFHKQNSF